MVEYMYACRYAPDKASPQSKMEKKKLLNYTNSGLLKSVLSLSAPYQQVTRSYFKHLPSL